ncbi:unnamed protein product [Closterium sp. NIES-64]|nr:unnamed protein product [Closterium sp. NIES-64]
MQSRSSQAAGAHDWRAALKNRGRSFQTMHDWGAKQEDQQQQVESREGLRAGDGLPEAGKFTGNWTGPSDAGRFTGGDRPSETDSGSSDVRKELLNNNGSSSYVSGSAVATASYAASQSQREACEPGAVSSARSAMEEVRRVEKKMEAMESRQGKLGAPESDRAVDADRSLDSNAIDRTIESPEASSNALQNDALQNDALLNKAAMERAIEAMERIGTSGGGDGGSGGDEGAGGRAGEGDSGDAEGGRRRGRGKDVAELEKEVEEAKQASHRIAVMFYQQDQELKDLRENHLALQEDHKRISVQLQAAQAETDELWNQLAAASRQKEAAEATAAELRLKIRMLAGNVEELEGEAEAAGGWGGGGRGGGGGGSGGGGGGGVGGTTAVEGVSSLESDLVGLRKLKELEWELISARSARDRAMTVLAGMREEWNNLRKLRLQLDALTASREVAGGSAGASGGRGAHAMDRAARGKLAGEDVRGRAYSGTRRGEEDAGEAGGDELLKGVESEIAEEADKWRKVVGQLQEDHVRAVVEAQDAAEKCAGARRQAEAASEEAMRLRRDIERVREEKTIAEEDLRDFRKGWKDLAGHLETFAAKVSEMDAELAVKRKEREVMAMEIERSVKERDLMAVEIGRVRKERDFMSVEIERLRKDRDLMALEIERLSKERDFMAVEMDRLSKERAEAEESAERARGEMWGEREKRLGEVQEAEEKARRIRERAGNALEAYAEERKEIENMLLHRVQTLQSAVEELQGQLDHVQGAKSRLAHAAGAFMREFQYTGAGGGERGGGGGGGAEGGRFREAANEYYSEGGASRGVGAGLVFLDDRGRVENLGLPSTGDGLGFKIGRSLEQGLSGRQIIEELDYLSDGGGLGGSNGRASGAGRDETVRGMAGQRGVGSRSGGRGAMGMTAAAAVTAVDYGTSSIGGAGGGAGGARRWSAAAELEQALQADRGCGVGSNVDDDMRSTRSGGSSRRAYGGGGVGGGGTGVGVGGGYGGGGAGAGLQARTPRESARAGVFSDTYAAPRSASRGRGGLRGSLEEDDGADAVSIATSIRRERERERERDRDRGTEYLQQCDRERRFRDEREDDDRISVHALEKYAPNLARSLNVGGIASSGVAGGGRRGVDDDEDARSVSSHGKTIEETYQRKTPLEHVLLRPDTYIGSVQTHVGPQWVWEQGRMVHREVRMVPGLYKIFDEILVNAADNKQRDPSMDAIKVWNNGQKIPVEVHAKWGCYVPELIFRHLVWNNGRGIPVEVHAKEGCYVPELIFGHLLTSSNYDDSARKTTGGRNGYGAKLANIFSTEFVVETADGSRQKKYKQVFSKNMSVKKEPVIKDCKPTDNFTSITFHPDLAKFGLDSLDADHVALMSRRVVDVAGCLGKSVKVTLNGTRVPVKSFADYAGLYLAPPPPPTPQPPATPPSSGEGGSGGGGGEGGEGAGAEGGVSAAEAAAAAAAAAAHPSTHEKLPRIHERVNDCWEVCVSTSDGQFQQVSFVNAIATTRGGTHVNMVSEQIVRYLLDKAQKKAATGKHGSASGAAAIKPHQVRSQLWVFVNCLVVNPAFDSQTKERLKHAPLCALSLFLLAYSSGLFQVRSQLWVFVNCLVVNPAFDSQTKETLNTRPSDFGSKCHLSEDFLKKVAAKCGIVEHLLSLAAHKQTKDLKRSDGSKRQRVSGITKLDDANEAGGRNAEHCTLILTEGDSAKTLAVSGLSVVGRDRYGVFPLRGKLLNVRDASHRQMMENTEIGHLKQILGLQHGKSYESVKALRYGHLMIMTDQDHDGSHIKGLLINLLHSCWPSLLKHPSFLREFITPIVKATGPRGRTLAFYTIPEYEAWKRTLGSEARQWKVKYYKGLGTSTPKEAKEYFAQLDRHRKDFEWRGEGDGERIEMAFSKKAVDARKQWLRSYEVSGGVGWRKSAGGRDWVGEGDGERIEMAFSKKAVDARKQWLCSYEPGTYLDQTVQRISYSDFVDKELILYSIADNMRSIPSVVDGLKPGQRKILFSCFKRKLHSDIKVAQLAGYVSEHAAYHHGEQSLMSTIVNLAQDFVGSNNVHLLVPSGQFGTRLQGGKDAASPRYIYTRLHRLTRVIFPVADDALLDYLDDDGQRIEPKWYVPILPMVLINGSEGIGTGWSSYVPTFNPRDVVANLKRRMRGEPMLPMHPWFRGFKGSIQLTSARQGGGNSYTVTGVATRLASSSGGRKGEKQPQQQGVTGVAITELPIRTWTQNYKEFLEGMMGGAGGGHGGGEGGGKVALIKDMRDNPPGVLQVAPSVEFEAKHPQQVVDDFYGIRLGYYEQRKEHQLVQLRHDLPFPYLLPIYLFLSWFILSFLLPFTVIEDFYGIRLGYYEQRKEHQLAQLRHELLRLDNRARFVRAVIQGDVVITNRKQADIVAQLKVRGFTPLPKGHAAAPVVVADVDPGSTDVSADGDDVEMDDVETPAGHKAGKGKNTAAAGKSGAAGKTAAAGAVPSAGAVGAAYEYLLGMPLWSLTWERVEQLERERRGKEEEVVVLQATSPLQLWERDLDLFLETLEHQQQCCEEEEVVPLQSTSPQQL